MSNTKVIEILISLSNEYRELGKSGKGLFAPDLYYAMSVGIQEAKERIEALPDEWISVEERLPEEFERVLILDEGVYLATYELEDFIIDGSYTYHPTHWQPLPNPPTPKQ